MLSLWLAFCDCGFHSGGCGIVVLASSVFPLTICFTHCSIGEGNGNPLQYSCLKNPRDGRVWWLPSMGSLRVGHNWATSLSLFTFMHWKRKWQPTPVFLPGESQGWGLPSMGLHRARHNWSDLAAAAAAAVYICQSQSSISSHFPITEHHTLYTKTVTFSQGWVSCQGI